MFPVAAPQVEWFSIRPHKDQAFSHAWGRFLLLSSATPKQHGSQKEGYLTCIMKVIEESI